MTVKFEVNLKTVKRAFALLNTDIPSDEEIERKLSDITVDLSGEQDEEFKQAELGFVMMAMSKCDWDN